MNYKKFLGAASAALMIAVAILMLAPGAWAQSKFKTLYKFKVDTVSGTILFGGLIFDQAGSLYGTTWEQGGTPYGTVFKLKPNADGSWTLNTLYDFKGNFYGGSDGGHSRAVLIFDAAGNLYGTTNFGGVPGGCDGDGCGVVFKLAPNADGSWTESLLYSFCTLTNCADGEYPHAGMTLDQSGNLYGTTSGGGAYGGGTVFELTPNADSTWTEHVLHAFTGGKDGNGPLAGLIFDQAGNLYSTASGGGAYGDGVVFKLTPNADGTWTEHVLHAFTGGKDGNGPLAGLIFDQAGNLYGTTDQGGDAQCSGLYFHGCGVVFKLTPMSIGMPWKETVLHAFVDGEDGARPAAGLIFDQAGSLYGTTRLGGGVGACEIGDYYFDCGVVFKLTPLPGGKEWRERVLWVFRNRPGAFPVAGLILDPIGNLYGTTEGDGYNTSGSVFEITP